MLAEDAAAVRLCARIRKATPAAMTAATPAAAPPAMGPISCESFAAPAAIVDVIVDAMGVASFDGAVVTPGIVVAGGTTPGGSGASAVPGAGGD